MPRLTFAVALLAALPLGVAGCSHLPPITAHPMEVSDQRLIPLSEVAQRLNLEVREGIMAREVFCAAPGKDFQLNAAKPNVYLVNGLAIGVEYPGIQWRDGQIAVPVGMYNSMCRDVGRIDALIKDEGLRSSSDYTDKIKLTPPELPVFTDSPAVVTENGPKRGTDKPASANTGLKGMTIVIDPGHGGKDPGGEDDHGHLHVREKDIVLNVSLAVAKLLRAQGATVILTRTEDVFVELPERAEIANNKKADLFVSIHANIAADADVVGVEAFVPTDATRLPKSEAAANKVLDGLKATCGSASRGTKPRDLRVLKSTKMPAVLVELGFLSNEDEARKLATTEFQSKLAKGVYDGIAAYAKA